MIENIPSVPVHDASYAKARKRPTAIKAKASFHAGKVQAALRSEIDEAEKFEQIHELAAVFPNAAECLDAGLSLTSCWLPMKTKFGRGPAVLGVQFVLLPSKDMSSPLTWLLHIRVKVLSRTTYPSDVGIHRAAKVILAAASPFEDIVAHVPDHRPKRDPARPAIDPEFREQRTSFSFISGDALLEHLRSSCRLVLRGAVIVKDVGGPVEDTSYGECC
jgi:hypothetical protein